VYQPTLDRVGLGQLGQVGQQVLGDVVPGLALAQAQVDVSARELVDVKLAEMSATSASTEPRVARTLRGVSFSRGQRLKKAYQTSSSQPNLIRSSSGYKKYVR
jgi:hypothetical protein